MSEHHPHQPNGEQGVNSYGTDDSAEQAKIEQARADASVERRRNRQRFEHLVEAGLNPEDAQSVVEQEEAERERAQQEASIAPPESEPEPAVSPRIYVRSVIDRRDGHEIGDWVDAGQDADAIRADIDRILARSLHAHWTDEPAVDWEITDIEGFGAISLDPFDSVEIIAALGQGIVEHGEAFAAWAEITDPRDMYLLEQFETAYFGAYDSRQAYAQHVFEAMSGEQELDALPDWIRHIVQIDYERMVHEMETSGEVRFVDHPGGVWVFDGRI